jgi:ferredoxin
MISFPGMGDAGRRTTGDAGRMSIQERFRRRLGPRNLQFAFGVFALLAGVLITLRQDAPHPLFQAAGTVGYTCAAALSFGSWFALGRAATAAPTRRILIVFHLIFVPAQFLFLLAHQMPWLGMLLSTMITVGLKPRIPRLGRTARKVWLTLHVGIGVGWLGIALGMLVLSIVGMTTDRHELRHNTYVLVETFDKALAIPSVFLVIVTGAVVSLGTPWGLIKHRWVLTKLIIALSLPILATFEGNHFPLIDAPSYLFIAGGIGIAPFIPMIEQLAANGARWHLVYRGQAPAAMAFNEQLARSHAQQVTISPADRQPRPDLAAILSAAPAGTSVYCCGPEAMLTTVETLMPTVCPQGTLHVERFAASSRASGIPVAPFEAEMRRSGRVVQVPADRSLLSVLQDIDPSLDFSCENGVCGSCETRVLAGVPDHRDDVLQPGDRDRRDVIYPCVSRVRGSRLVLDL